MSKNIVICCDGTGNAVSADISNVLKLYRMLKKESDSGAKQIALYDPGVGTLPTPDRWKKKWQDTKNNFRLAFGYGLDENILDAYNFLIDHYQKGDSIYLFGFSRGAYTVRALAGMLHKVGLLWPDQKNLAADALVAYKQTSREVEDREHRGDLTQKTDDPAWQFSRIVSAQWPTIKFIGVWDTVASVIVPRFDRWLFLGFEKLPYTQRNVSVEVFRQAIAIDERRCMFRLSRWEEDQDFLPIRFQRGIGKKQDIKQVWFAGVHSDIGGGYPEKESGPSKYCLLWMVGEAEANGLKVIPETVDQLARGHQRPGSPWTYAKPSVEDPLHNSLNPAWKALEFAPKLARYKEWPKRRVWKGWYIPRSEPRFIPDGAFIHESVRLRMERPNSGYRPINLPLHPKWVELDIQRLQDA